MARLNKREIPLTELKHWFEEEKRIFPWRENPTPYRVWVSEVMLQQTRASVVIPYFERWMSAFPTIKSLASAKIEEVIKLWEGLGYYSRARALHQGAKYLLEVHNGELPSDENALRKVKGLGPYTVGAICSFAFHQKKPAVDGNVKRVISRLFCIEEDIDKSSTQNQIYDRVFSLLPDKEPWIIMEALIELGATFCSKKPQCEKCPLNDGCLGYHLGKADLLPKKKKPAKVTYLERIVPVIRFQNEFLIQKHQGKKVMADLYEFPYLEKDNFSTSFYPAKLQFLKNLKEVKHTFTRFQAHLFPQLFQAEQKKEIEGFEWIEKSKLINKPFSSGHRKILQQLLEDHAHLTH